MRASRIILAVLLLSYFALACFYVPRLTNCIWSDSEFTGWVAPIAHHMVEGKHLHSDLTLPIPPGSFLILAGVQKALGRFLLIDELWVCALSNLTMIGIGYLIARAFTSRLNASIVALLGAPAVILTPKEIAYDQTTQVIAWGAVALLAHALTTAPSKRRMWLLRAAGFAASFTLAFKSSTGTGAVLGTIAALVALTTIEAVRNGKTALRATIPQWIAVLGGMAVGIGATVLMVVLARGNLVEFYQVVFVDGPALKGGRGRMLLNLLGYTVFQTPVHLSLLITVLTAYLLARIMGSRDGLQVETKVNDEESDTSRRGIIFALVIASLLILFVSIGIAMLATDAPRIPSYLKLAFGFAAIPAVLGLMFLGIFTVTNLHAAASHLDRRAAYGATALCAGAISLMHNLSHPQHRPFYDNNPIIPLAFLTLILITDRANTQKLKYLFILVSMLGLFGDKFQRWLDARHPVDDRSFWYGMKVSDNGLEVLRAAQRARELAGPNGTVLMLPEDPAMEALIGRSRPNLMGAIAFVDQYPKHVLRRDLALLQAYPPDVVVLHPYDESWKRVYRTWAESSPAETLQTEFLGRMRETTYQSDSTYPAWMFGTPTMMEVLVRKQ